MNRVTDLADPRRCQAPSKDGQCLLLAEHGSDRCHKHGGINTLNDEETRSYLLATADHRRRLAQISDHLDPIRELRESVALMHYMCEQILSICNSPQEVDAASPRIEKLVHRTESLLKTGVQLSKDLKELLPRSSVLMLGQSITQILIAELSDIEGYEERVDRINARLMSVTEDIT